MRNAGWTGSLVLFVVASVCGALGAMAGVAHAQTPLTVEYLGNEGFYLAAGDEDPRPAVLIDALYRDGVSGYVPMPAGRQDSLENARPPFDAVRLILATHHHADHFDPVAVGAHLGNNPEAIFISTGQAVERLRAAVPDFAALEDRVRTARPAEGERLLYVENGVLVEALHFHHGRNRPIENLAFVIHLGGWRILHVGDTMVQAEDIAGYALPDDGLDVAFLPYWMLAYDDWADTIPAALAPARRVAMHLPPPEDPAGFMRDVGGFEGLVNRIEARFPGTHVFRRERERQVFVR